MKENEMLEKEVTTEEKSNESSVDEIKKQVIEIVEDLSLMAIQNADVTLIGDLSMDSLRMVMLLVTLEDTFEIELDESDMNPFSLITVQDVIDLAIKYVSPAKEAAENA